MHKKISFRRLASALIPLLVIIFVFTVAANIVANYYFLTLREVNRTLMNLGYKLEEFMY